MTGIEQGLWTAKVAIVAGGAAGIGASVADAGVREGGRVWVLDVDEVAGQRTCERLGDAARFRAVDVTDECALGRLVEEVLAVDGRIDVLVNSASKDAAFDPQMMSQAEWDRFMTLDLKAPWLTSRAVLPAMERAGTGSIVNIASLHATQTAEGSFPYGAAKAGLAGLTRSLALDVGKLGIRVNTVCPGWTSSERIQEHFATLDPAEVARIERGHALRRVARPEEVAEVVVFLGSDRASFVTGASWAVDGGLGSRHA